MKTAHPSLRLHPRRRLRRSRRRVAPRLRPGAARGLRRPRRHCALVAHPARSPGPRVGRRVHHGGRPRDSRRPKLGRFASRTPPRPGSTLAASTPPACNGACCVNEKLAAARDGKRIKEALERSLDARPRPRRRLFRHRHVSLLRRRRAGGGQGPPLLAPAARRRRKKGLAQMLRARTAGRLLQGEADYQLHLSISGTSTRPARALELLRGLQKQLSGQSALSRADRRDPGRLPARHDGEPRDLARAARAGARATASTVRRWPKCGPAGHRAASRRARTQTDDAIDHLERVDRAQAGGAVLVAGAGVPAARRSARSPRTRAPRRWRPIARASLARSDGDPYDIRAPGAERLRRAPDARRPKRSGSRSKAGAARAERSARGGRRARTARSRSTRAIRWRAIATAACSRRAATMPAALAQFEPTIRDARPCPPPILGTAYLEAARLHERAGRRARRSAPIASRRRSSAPRAETHRAAARATRRDLESATA